MSKSVCFSSAATCLMWAFTFPLLFPTPHGMIVVVIFRKIGFKALTLVHVVDAVTNEDVVGLRFGLHGLVVAGVEQPADEFAADAFVVNVGRGEVRLGGEQNAQRVFELRLVRRN